MNKLEEITLNLSSQINWDDRFNHELRQGLAHDFLNIRASRLEQDFNKTNNFLPATIQDLGCLEMEQVDIAECCSTEVGCKVWRTKLEIPEPIQVNRYDPFSYVGDVDRTGRYTRGTSYLFAKQAQAKFKGIEPYFMYFNNRIYATRAKIRVMGMFQDPVAAAEFKHCADSACAVDTKIYTPVDMVFSIEEQILRNRIGKTNTVSEDTKVNPNA